jgi:hypothetical protein
MKKLYYFSFLLLLSCSADSNAQETIIIDYLETSSNDVRTDLKIDILKLEISDITVADSIAILEEKYEEEILNKIKIAEGAVTTAQKSVDNLTTKIDTNDASTLQKRMDKIGDKTLQNVMLKNLEEKMDKLREAQEWQPEYLTKYAGRDDDVLLVKKAIATFSYFNPKLNTRQERTENFVLSKDEAKVLGVVSKKK